MKTGNGTAEPIFDAEGTLIGYRGVDRNITERVKAKDALRKSYDELTRTNKALQAEIAERRQTESALRNSEEKFAESFLKSPIPMAITSMKDGRYIEVNDAFARAMGLRCEDLRGKTSTDAGYITGEQRALFLEEYRRKGFVENLELQIHVKDGELRCGLFNSSKITINDEDFFLTVVTDVTELRRMEKNLEESERRYRKLFSGVPVGIFRTTPDGHILEANPALVHILGYPDREALLAANAAAMYLDPEDRKQWQVTTERERVIRGFETRLKRLNGGIIWVRVSGRIVYDGEDRTTYYEGTMEDITERKQAEESLRSAQEELIRKERLAVIGQLAGVVGHEIRNPLGVMNNAVYFLKAVMTGADSTVKEYLDIIEQEIDKSQQIISELLDFARTKTPQVAPVAVRELARNVLGKCRIPDNVLVKTDIPDALPLINVDPFQISQVLQNFIINAMQAMPAGGTLTIGARPVPGGGDQGPAEGTAEPRTPSPEPDFVEISISDTGEGISPENMPKLFQPLFSTKAKGIGGGLVICRNLTEANGGRIEVESTLGKGTNFKVTLPRCKT